MADVGGEYPTVLGPDLVIKGEITFEKGMRIQGRVEGKITTAGRLHIAKEAKVAADVDAGAIIVEGDVRGNLSASDRVELKNSARYEGDLACSKLTVDEGAVFSGHVSVGPEAVKNRGGAGVRPAGASTPPPQTQPARQG